MKTAKIKQNDRGGWSLEVPQTIGNFATYADAKRALFLAGYDTKKESGTFKTARDWFSLLPDDIEQMACNNQYDLDCEADSLAMAIKVGFAWGNTSEGYHFWNEIHSQAANRVYE